MRSLRELSSSRDSLEELADWVEISTFFRADRAISKEDLTRSLVREGETRSEHLAREKATEAFNELGTCEEAVGNAIVDAPIAAYPFQVDGDVLRLKVDPFAGDHPGLLYVFLLAITRASMDSQSRQLKNIDPTSVFEEVCAESLCEFWGGRTPVSDVFVTGTSKKVTTKKGKRFPALINRLVGHLDEGGGWKKGAKSPKAGDGGLDLAVWRRFKDKRPGGLVGFAQCKTGDHWKDHLGRKNPTSICGAYLRSPLIVSPLPIFMVPCRVSGDEWVNVMQQHTGIIFDRCRIATFGTKLPGAVAKRCKSWASAAIDRELADLVAKKLVTAPVGAAP